MGVNLWSGFQDDLSINGDLYFSKGCDDFSLFSINNCDVEGIYVEFSSRANGRESTTFPMPMHEFLHHCPLSTLSKILTNQIMHPPPNLSQRKSPSPMTTSETKKLYIAHLILRQAFYIAISSSCWHSYFVSSKMTKELLNQLSTLLKRSHWSMPFGMTGYDKCLMDFCSHQCR